MSSDGHPPSRNRPRMSPPPWMSLLFAFALAPAAAIAQAPPERGSQAAPDAAGASGSDVAANAGAHAAAPATDDVPIVDHDTIVVTGQMAGPGLWKVRKGEHVLYVMATLSPLARRMQWESAGVESVVARSGRVLLPPSFTLDPGVGMFRGMFLLPSLFKARRNPDGTTLEQAVGPALYARWRPLKQRYLGGDRGVERWRPIFAAQELYEAAMRKSGLSHDDVVDREVRRMARRHDVPLRGVDFRIELEDAKATIREFQATTLADTECFARTLARIESDLETMRRQANAWASGDLATLQALHGESRYRACIRAVSETALAQRLGVGEVGPRLEAMWLAAAEEALAAHDVSLAMLPLDQVIAADGYLARLRERGYEVEAP